MPVLDLTRKSKNLQMSKGLKRTQSMALTDWRPATDEPTVEAEKKQKVILSRVKDFVLEGQIPVDLDLKKAKQCLVLCEPTRRAYGGYHSALLWKDKPLQLKFPPMCLAWDMNKSVRSDGRTTLSIELDFWHRTGLKETKDFFVCLQIIEAAIYEKLASILRMIPGSSFKAEELSEIFLPNTRDRVSGEGKIYPPRISVKIWPSQSVIFPLKHESVVGEDGSESTCPLDETILCKGQWLTAVIQCTGLWVSFAKKKITSATLGWRMVEGRLVPPPANAPIRGQPLLKAKPVLQ